MFKGLTMSKSSESFLFIQFFSVKVATFVLCSEEKKI